MVDAETGVNLPADSTLGRYRLLKKIARGGMAEVFAAKSFGAHGFEKTVAIKRILPKYGDDPQFVRMMVDEAKITVLLNHPNVAQILELCELEGDYFIVMEFVPGASLQALRKRLHEINQRIPDLEACFIVVEILQGLHAAHIQRDVVGNPANIIHRDVSPQNVLVSFDGHVKVIDFGIARARTRLEMTEIGTIKGKLRYLAPEMIDPARFMKTGDFDHRVDVFAAGIVLWELIASRTLYQGEDEMAVYDAITETDAPDLHGMKLCDKELARIVRKGLARDPEERFHTAEEFADELRAYVYRRDPAFTAKRVSALLDKCFPQEKEEMLALERGQVSGPHAPAPSAPPANPAMAAKSTRERSNERKAERNVENKFADKSGDRQERAEKAKSKEKSASKQPRPQEPVPVPVDAATRTHIAHNDSPSSARSGEHKNPVISATADGHGPDTRGADLHNGSSRGTTPHETVYERARSGDNVPGDVLTVMTLVSRKSNPAARAPNSGGDRASGRADKPRAETSRPGDRDFAVGATTTASDPLADTETPGTSDSLRSRTLGRAPSRGRMVLASAALGIVLAVSLVIILEVSGRDDDKPTHPSPPVPVILTVTSNAPGATAMIANVRKPCPAQFEVLPGDVLDAIVQAPGYLDAVEHVKVPRDHADDLSRSVGLLRAPDLAVDAGVAVDPPVVDAGVAVAVPVPVVDAGVREAPVREVRDRDRDRGKKKGNGSIDVRLKKGGTVVWANIVIDGKPFSDTAPATIKDVGAGTHKLVVTSPKGVARERVVTVKPGDETVVVFDFD